MRFLLILGFPLLFAAFSSTMALYDPVHVTRGPRASLHSHFWFTRGPQKFSNHVLAKRAAEPDLCKLPRAVGGAEVGACRVSPYFPFSGLELWYFNTQAGDCEQFFYGGCGGNANRFWSKAECRNTCLRHRG